MWPYRWFWFRQHVRLHICNLGDIVKRFFEDCPEFSEEEGFATPVSVSVSVLQPKKSPNVLHIVQEVRYADTDSMVVDFADRMVR